VRSYDIPVSFVSMPIVLIAFGPIASWIGLEHTLLGAAALAAATTSPSRSRRRAPGHERAEGAGRNRRCVMGYDRAPCRIRA
jgi:hypothetical protein